MLKEHLKFGTDNMTGYKRWGGVHQSVKDCTDKWYNYLTMFLNIKVKEFGNFIVNSSASVMA